MKKLYNEKGVDNNEQEQIHRGVDNICAQASGIGAPVADVCRKLGVLVTFSIFA